MTYNELRTAQTVKTPAVFLRRNRQLRRLKSSAASVAAPKALLDTNALPLPTGVIRVPEKRFKRPQEFFSGQNIRAKQD
jgi:hypothetical protein